MIWKPLTLTGWGRSRHAAGLAARPERIADAIAVMADAGGHSLIAHGAGRSYGDVALNHGGQTLLTGRLNRLLAFDPATGAVTAEPGVTFADLLDVFLPLGFLAPVTPGTAFTTLGGAVANDVHGKDHEVRGSFGDHLLWIDLLLPSGAIVRATPDQRPELFQATIGGLGLTGVILALCFRMMPVPSNAVLATERRMPDLDAFFAAFAERGEASYSVGWIDGLSRGRRLGRGNLITAVPAAADVASPPGYRRVVPFDLPDHALNSWSIRAFNTAYYHGRVSAAGRQVVIDYRRFLYPLDTLLHWNRIYGRRGFHQFQAVVPTAAAVQRLLEAITDARAASFLTVLKALGGGGRGYLSFPMAGYTLALDFPNRSGIGDLMARLERLTLDHGGRIYLAKDSWLSPAGFAAMYPQRDRFRAVLAEVDPTGRMGSDLARRLEIRAP